MFRIISIAALFYWSSPTIADTVSARRMHLDSMSKVIQQKMERLDSTIIRLDRMMDSITGKQTKSIDTIALYKYLLERNKQKQRQKESLYIKIGLICIAAVIVLAGWGRWRKMKN